MTWHFVTARERAVIEKGLINYCTVEWIRGGGTVCSSGGCADWLTVSIFRYILATTQEFFMGNLATNSHFFPLKRIPHWPTSSSARFNKIAT